VCHYLQGKCNHFLFTNKKSNNKSQWPVATSIIQNWDLAINKVNRNYLAFNALEWVISTIISGLSPSRENASKVNLHIGCTLLSNDPLIRIVEHREVWLESMEKEIQELVNKGA
jgi:hypothetical protein